MKLPRFLLAGLGVSLLTAAQAVQRLPIEDFARGPTASHARLSPDGKRLAFIREYQGRNTMFFVDLDENKVSQLSLGEAGLIEGAVKGAESFVWVSDKRLAITTSIWGDTLYGMLAVDWNGAHPVPISGYEDNKIELNRSKFWAHEIVHVFRDNDHSILLLDRHDGGVGNPRHPDLVKVDTVTGSISTVEKNPGEVVGWGIDLDGVPRLGILSHGDLSGAIYRDGEKAPWRTILPLANRRQQMSPLGFDAASGRMLVRALTPERRWTAFPLDPTTGELGEPLLQDPEYDIAPVEYSPAKDGIPLAGPIFSLHKRAMVGLRYYTESARLKWYDRDFATFQQVVDRYLPDTVNMLVDESDDGKRSLWFAYSDQNPGMYFLLDGVKRSFKQLARYLNGINPAQMAATLSVKYPARDGLIIHGYLTVPVGHEPKGLPLVVLPHGGPWVRDVWGFDPLVQLLANRGYAVLQMNYRGSTGYGEELLRTARRQIGGKIQDDIEDGTKWAIAAGVADPKQIAIMGASYGGYSTLFALGHNAGLYRCGVSIAGVTDWMAFFDDSDIAEYKRAKQHWRDELGDPANDKEKLRAISPVNFADQIDVPVLIIQGKKDERVPPDQAKRMVAALEKVGRKPESLYISGLGHTYGNEKQRTEIFKAVVAFLEKNLGPGVQ